jgi:glycosyltransferase involved in cell wall biosynthesis
MEIIISDNCSTDDTQQIAQDAIDQGFNCRYIRNETNLGMDGNFINCFRKATGRYVWLLGDDDLIIIESLVRIVSLLDVKEEYGLLHIYQKKDLSKDIFYITDSDYMIKTVSYYITFISANIVNTKYVDSIDLEKYRGTWLSQIPLYLHSSLNEKQNILYSMVTFDCAQDSLHNGGYNYFEVFVRNYHSILREYIYNKELLSWLKKDTWPFVWKYTKMLLIKKQIGNFKTNNSWKILFKYYGNKCYFWWSLIKYPFEVIKRKIYKLL